jgi:predicted DNA-binding WGR domain protein
MTQTNLSYETKALASSTRRSSRISAAKKKITTKKNKNNTKNNTRTRNTPVSKRRKTGMTTAVNTSAPLGVIDPESGITRGSIEMLDNEPCDAMLVLVDPAKSIDKFFIIQLIQRNRTYSDDSYVVYSRWGRTGTVGQGMEENFNSYDDAVNCFENKFEQKTGLSWEDRENPTVGNKHRFIKQNFQQKKLGYTSAEWQYWVDDGVCGKADGWYDYDAAGSIQVEQLYHEYTSNPRYSQRHIDSGIFTYNVDLANMTQTNTKHSNHTTRRIRRCPVGVRMDNRPPIALVQALNLPPGAPAYVYVMQP